MAGFEFVRNALDGMGGERYSIDEINAFLDAFEPLFVPENVATSPLGRSLTGRSDLHDRPIGEVVYELTGRTRDDLMADLDAQVLVTIGQFDPYDVHLVAAAVEAGADGICTNNTQDFSMERIGELEVLTSYQLGRRFDLV